MRIAVVEDNKEMLEIICAEVCDNMDISCQCNGFLTAEKLLEKIEKQSLYDVYLLDIEIPEMNGLELAKVIRKRQKNAVLVFITAYKKYAFDTYVQEVKAYQYILKEKLQERLPGVLRNIKEEFIQQKSASYIIQNQHYYVNIKQADIQYIYKEDKNSVFVTNDEIYRERKAIRDIWEELKDSGFIRVDAGRLINICFIKRLEGNVLTLVDGTEMYLSNSNIKKVKDEIRDYHGGEDDCLLDSSVDSGGWRNLFVLLLCRGV